MESGPVGNDDQAVNKGMNNNGGGTSSNFLCRQSSTRWTPTTDQIRILKDLYYNNGVRSPTAEQIQKISAKLRQYGKIEGKNVFYWFQNHKARERQKKRFTTTNINPTDHFNIPNVHCYRPPLHHTSGTGFLCNNVNDDQYHHVPPVFNNKFPYMNATTFQGGGSSTGYLNGGSMCNNGYGSMAMEISFRGERSMGYSIRQREEEDDSATHHHAIETLPLFPMHDEIKHQTSQDHYFFNSYGINAINGSACHDWHNISDPVKQQAATCPRASLELTLNSNGFSNLNN